MAGGRVCADQLREGLRHGHAVTLQARRQDEQTGGAVVPFQRVGGDFPGERDARLGAWSGAPGARISHPREEHLLPLMVAAGAAGGEPGVRVFNDTIMGAVTSGFRFG